MIIPNETIVAFMTIVININSLVTLIVINVQEIQTNEKPQRRDLSKRGKDRLLRSILTDFRPLQKKTAWTFYSLCFISNLFTNTRRLLPTVHGNAQSVTA